MKYCPNCQTSYADDSLKFCLQDGTPLREVSDADSPTVAFDDAETIMSSRQVEPIRVPVQNPLSQQYRRQTELPPVIAVQPAARKSRTGLAVGLTILGMLLVFGIAGIGALIYFRDKKTEVAVNVNNAPVNSRPLNANSANSQTLNQNSNLGVANLSPSPTTTPKPTLNPQQAKTITDDVKNVVDEWKNDTENLDLDAHLSNYADTVDYYKGGRVGLAKVRADKQRAYEQYDSINLNISNLKITPDEAGDRATAVFDKEWHFEGDEKNSSGKVQQQLTLQKIGGRWLITGERDLKVYYVDK